MLNNSSTKSKKAPDSGGPAPTSLRFLILGATGHIGPHFVRAALDRGHKVSIFARGVHSLDLPSAVEILTGDRNDNLGSIMNRNWNAVFDLVAYGPKWIRALGSALKGRIGHYTFISTQDVYGSWADAPDEGYGEDSKVEEYSGTADPYTSSQVMPGLYGCMKALCEVE